MKKSFAHSFVLALLLAGQGLAQENYANWRYYRFITVNTTSGGANVAATQTNFPLLVRLNSSNFNFSHARRNGEDIRFANVAGAAHYKYQIENWDSVGQSATVWVLMPTIAGNSSTTFRIYSGRSVAVDSSNGAAVFSTANNFQGVFHLGEATNDTARDATVNRFKGVPKNKGGVNPTDTIGAIGHAKKFLGDTASGNNNGGSYQILTSTGGNTFTNNALNFQNDSATAGGNGLPQYTISAWIYVHIFPYSTLKNKAIVAKSAGSTVPPQYMLKLSDPSIVNITTPLGDTMRVQFVDPIPGSYKSGTKNLVKGNWYHVAAVRSGAVGDSTHLRVWINGYAPPTGPGITSKSSLLTTHQDLNVYIGSFSNDSGYFTGKIDEVEFSSTARDSSWLKLSYETQRPGSLVVSVGPVELNPEPPGPIIYVTNPLSLVAGTVMTPDSAIVTNAVSFLVSPALPAGLTLNATTGTISGTPTANVDVPNTTYTITANGAGGAISMVGLSIRVRVPPAITNQPVASSPPLNPLPAGGIARFGIKAIGSPLIYKWVRTRGTNIDTLVNSGTAPAAVFSGATTDTLTITNPPLSDDGTTYKCVVRNSAGLAVSNSGLLRVQVGGDIGDHRMIHVNGTSPFSFRIPPTTGISNVRMTIENMSGRAVWSGDFKLGASREVSWNGKGADGRPVSNGMYVVKMKMLDLDGNFAGENVQAGIKAR